MESVTVGYERWPTTPTVHLTVTAGSTTAIVGANAAGKTTLLRGLFGAGAWLKGRIEWRGKAVKNLRSPLVPRQDVAWIRQDRPVFPGMRLVDALGVALSDAGWARRDRLIEGVLKRLPEVGTYLHQRLETLSGGQRALASVVVGLVEEPLLVCLDEPAAGLDEATMKRLNAVIRAYIAERGAGCLLIEHRETFLNGLAQSVVSL